MGILQFRDIVGSDKKALTYLKSVCRVIGGNACPECGDDEILEIDKGKRKRCGGCGHRFTIYSRRWLNETHIPASSWLWIIKLFEMELTATKISQETGISYPTTLKAVTAIRKSIASTTLHGISFLQYQGTRKKDPVYYSTENGGVEVSELLPASRIRILERLEHGHLICTDRDIRKDLLICEGVDHGLADFGRGRSRFHYYLAHSFGAKRFIVERLQKFHGVKDSLLPLYVLEMEYRLNNRGRQLFEMLVENVCRFVPPGIRKTVSLNPIQGS